MKKRQIVIGLFLISAGIISISFAEDLRIFAQEQKWKSTVKELDAAINKESSDYIEYQKALNTWAESKEKLGKKKEKERLDFCIYYNMKKSDGLKMTVEGEKRGKEECEINFPTEQ